MDSVLLEMNRRKKRDVLLSPPPLSQSEDRKEERRRGCDVKQLSILHGGCTEQLIFLFCSVCHCVLLVCIHAVHIPVEHCRPQTPQESANPVLFPVAAANTIISSLFQAEGGGNKDVSFSCE